MADEKLMRSECPANWWIELRATCPHCQAYTNLLDHPEFWEGKCSNVCDEIEDVEVTCPECGKDFICDFEMG